METLQELSPEAFAAQFDAQYFADYEKQLETISVEEQAAIALADVLTVKKADGAEKSYEELKSETQTFFANEWVQSNEAVMNYAAAQFAAACMGHVHGSELARDEVLSSVFDKGVSVLFDGHELGNTHHSADQDHTSDDDDEEDSPRHRERRLSRVGHKAAGWFRKRRG